TPALRGGRNLSTPACAARIHKARPARVGPECLSALVARHERRGVDFRLCPPWCFRRCFRRRSSFPVACSASSCPQCCCSADIGRRIAGILPALWFTQLWQPTCQKTVEKSALLRSSCGWLDERGAGKTRY